MVSSTPKPIDLEQLKSAMAQYTEYVFEIDTKPKSYPIGQVLLNERRKALDDAAKLVESVSHEGLHGSMWEAKFSAVAGRIRGLMKEQNGK